MSTHARIGMENEDGSITSIYVHFDGYPEHTWPTLTKHYTDPEKLLALMELGDLSVLAQDLGEEHPFDDHDSHKDWCLAYGRDRGEENVGSVTHTAEDWPEYGQAYEYLFTAEGWRWRSNYGNEHRTWLLEPTKARD